MFRLRAGKLRKSFLGSRQGKEVSSFPNAQIGSVAHLAPFSTDTGRSFPGTEEAAVA
jgi:hypothetical protein